ncbi:MAG: AMP-binding protein [Rhizobiaceae bacterium]|nr:AMP-binding protein [Rhizobiaceae bacterium]
MLEKRDSYDALIRDFRWRIPERFNIGVAVSDRWAAIDPDRVAIHAFDAGDGKSTLTFGELARQSDALGLGLRGLGIGAGDRVALLLPQSFEAAIGHVAIYKIGAVAVPLALLFGVEALEYRLKACGAKAVITNAGGAATLAAIRGALPELAHVVVTEAVDPGAGLLPFHELAARADRFQPVETGPDDPALMIFTSGTTGPPKGALHGHRVLLGHLPGFEMAYQFPPQADDVMWTPADWAWAGGLLNAMLPALYLGIPVVAGRFERFNPRTAFDLMERMGVTLAFLPPTALRMMKGSGESAKRRALRLRAVMSAGEQLGRETYEWAEQEFGLTVNEFYGQTECNLVIGSCAALGAAKAGATGRAVPGHVVEIIDAKGNVLPQGEVGQIAVRRPDPVMFLGYWQDAAATEKKFLGDRMLTGDQGHVDNDGFIHFFGRDDDVITSAGYRIGPGEIEDCLVGHPEVALAAAVGKPDSVRTEIVKAYVVPKPGVEPSEELARRIQLWVRSRLSAHEYPREIEFVDSVPLTTSGKVIRRIFRERAKLEAQGKTAAGN